MVQLTPDGARMKRTVWKLGLLLTIALCVRLGAGCFWQSRIAGRFGLGDSQSYWHLGAALAKGSPYEYGPLHARVFRARATRWFWRRSSAYSAKVGPAWR